MRHINIICLAAVSLLTITSCGPRQACQVVDETYVHKYGVPVSPDYWTASGQHGTVISKMADGVTVAKAYQSGHLEGETTFTFPHSDKIQKTHTYKQNKLIKELEFYADGTPKKEVIYEYPTAMRDVKTWYTTGSPRSHERYDGNLLLSGEYLTSNNQPDSVVDNYYGERIQRDDYGQLVSRDVIADGYCTLSITYHPNGTPQEQIPFKNGVAEGLKKTFYPGGEPKTVEMWANGTKNGITIIFTNGEKFAEVPYVNGVKTGVEQRYKDGSLVVQEISWENDQLHGPTNIYVGNAINSEWYYRGNPTTKANFEALMNRPAP